MKRKWEMAKKGKEEIEWNKEEREERGKKIKKGKTGKGKTKEGMLKGQQGSQRIRE